MKHKYQKGVSGTLARVRTLLKEFSRRKEAESQDIPSQVIALREELAGRFQTSQQITSSVIGTEHHERTLRGILWRKLRQGREAEQIWEQSNELRRRPGQHYSLSHLSLPALMKDVVENSRLVEEELVTVAQNLKALQEREGGEEGPMGIGIWCLVKLVMQDTSAQLDELLSQLLFRAYILQESITLLLLKTCRALALMEKQLGECDRHALSEKSGKRSALSESIEVFRRNQMLQELQQVQPSGCGSASKALIQSDYRMTRRGERKVPQRMNCCF